MNSTGAGSILILCNDTETERQFVLYLSKYGYRVQGVGLCRDAARIILSTQTDLLVTDLSLPDGGGLGFITRLRMLDSTKAIRTIVLSQTADRRVVAAAVQAGADAFVLKDNLLNEHLLSRVEQLMGRPTAPAHISQSPSKPPLENAPLVSENQIERMLKKESGARSLAFTIQRVISLVSSRMTSGEQLAGAIEKDPALTIRVLRVANSAFYGGGSLVETIPLAIVKLGFREVARIAMSVTVIDLISRKDTSNSYKRVALWEHCLSTAILARSLARDSGLVPEDEAYTAGLIHDIARFVMDDYFPDEMKAAIEMVKQKAVSMNQAEHAIFGMNHQDIGRRLGLKWRLSSDVVQMLGAHHNPLKTLCGPNGATAPLTVVIGLADRLSKIGGLGGAGDDYLEEIDFQSCEAVGIKRTMIANALSSTENETRNAIHALAATLSVCDADTVLEETSSLAAVCQNQQAVVYGSGDQVATIEMLLHQTGLLIKHFDSDEDFCKSRNEGDLTILIPHDTKEVSGFLDQAGKICPVCNREHDLPPLLVFAPKSETIAPDRIAPHGVLLQEPWSIGQICEALQTLTTLEKESP